MSGIGSSTPVVKIVTDNAGRYWVKTESGSCYFLSGNPRYLHHLRKAISDKVRDAIATMTGR